MTRGKVVIVTGLIGSGKSTLSRELAGALGEGTLWLQEPDEKSNRNPYLADYYTDPARYSLTMQLHLLGMRYRAHQHAQWHTLNSGCHAVMDSSYWQDTAFARLQMKMGVMTEREFETYQVLYQAMTAAVLYPSVCVRVLVNPVTCNQRIAKRMEREQGRRCENAIDLKYLQGLDQEIDHMVSVLRAQGVLVLDMPWDIDRDSPDARLLAVQSLAARITANQPLDLFLDLHRRAL